MLYNVANKGKYFIFTSYHLYPQFLHSNCDRAVLLNKPKAYPCAARFTLLIFAMLVEPQVGHLGLLMVSVFGLKTVSKTLL